MNMIEKVSLALAEKMEDRPSSGSVAFMRPLAEVAIKAMRDPNDAMIVGADVPDMPAGGDAADIWRSMVDLALEGK